MNIISSRNLCGIFLLCFVRWCMLLTLAKSGELICSLWKLDLLEFSWHVPIPFLLLFAAATAPQGLTAKATKQVSRHPPSLHSKCSIVPVPYVCIISALELCLFHVLCTVSGWEHYTPCPPTPTIMQSPSMLPSLWSRQSEARVNTSIQKPPGWGGNVIQITRRPHVCNIKVLYMKR